MDPITRICCFLIGGAFLLNRVATAKLAKKEKVGSDGPLEKRMGRGSPGVARHDAGGETRHVPVQHLPVTEAPAAADAAVTPEPMPAASPAPDLAVLTVTRDRKSGKFTKKAA